jgi:predicted metalloprotease
MDTGSAAQRLRWAQRGFESGNFEGCDTFGSAAKGEL